MFNLNKKPDASKPVMNRVDEKVEVNPADLEVQPVRVTKKSEKKVDLSKDAIKLRSTKGRRSSRMHMRCRLCAHDFLKYVAMFKHLSGGCHAHVSLTQRPCFSNQYTTFPTTTILPEITALAAAVAPAATSIAAQPSLRQPWM